MYLLETSILQNIAFRLDGSNIFHVLSVPNKEKIGVKNCVFFNCIFEGILEGFWGGFGRVWGGVLELFFATWGYFF